MNRGSALGTLGALGALALATLAARAQQGDANWQRIVAAAKREGSVVIYHQAVPQVLERISKDFMVQYPEIKVEVRRLLTPVTHMQAIETEKAGKIDGADITQYANAIWHRDKAQENFFLKPVGPATADYPKESLQYGAVPIVAVMPFVLAYNSNLVKTPITSMRDLLRPEFQGKVGSSDLVAKTVYAFYEWIENPEGRFSAAVCGAKAQTHGRRRALAAKCCRWGNFCRAVGYPCSGEQPDRTGCAVESDSAIPRLRQRRCACRPGALQASERGSGVS